MYGSRRGTAGINRKLNKHASTILICGIFLFFSGILYLSLCKMPCDSNDAVLEAEEAQLGEADDEAIQANWPLWDFPKPQGKLKAFLVILIMSSPDGIQRRDAIRETWLSEHPDDIQPFFVIGSGSLSEKQTKHLAHENDHEHDLLLLRNVNDSYFALTNKLLESIVWLDKHVDYKFVMKADDDTFARLDIIVPELREKEPKRLYWGFFDGRAKVKKTGQWAEKSWVLCDTYLPHARGGGYFLSFDLAHYVAIGAKYLKKFNSEDISMGAWLSAVEVNRVHDPRFDTEYMSRGCFNSYIVTHKQGIPDMKTKHKLLKETKGTRMCENEVRVRLSYNYNWNVPPSKCCIRNDSSVL